MCQETLIKKPSTTISDSFWWGVREESVKTLSGILRAVCVCVAIYFLVDDCNYREHRNTFMNVSAD